VSKNKSDHPAAEGAGALRRRDFLALGSLAALAPLAPFFDRAAHAAGASVLTGAGDEAGGSLASSAGIGAAGQAAQAAALPMSVGYLEGSDGIENLRKLPPDLAVLMVTRRGGTFAAGRHVEPAVSYPSGDASLVGGPVRMTVHDLYPRTLPRKPALAKGWPQAIDLDVLVPLLDPPRGSTARFAAWSYRRLPAENRSARVSFVLWPDWYSDLSIVLRVVPATGAPRLLQGRFTLGADAGRPRLMKGIYLLGLQTTTWNEAADLPDDASQLAPELLSVVVTVEPEGVRGGASH
jgi:hypothetical protein